MLSNYKLKKYSDNLERILNNANQDSINSGLNWYNDFYLWSENLAKKYNYKKYLN